MHSISQSILPYILLGKISNYISTSITNHTPISIIDLITLLYTTPPIPSIPFLNLDPFLVVTNKDWVPLTRFHNPQYLNSEISNTFQNLFDHVTTLQATKLIEFTWQSFTQENHSFSPETFTSLCLQSSTTLDKWAISCNFLNFTTNYNLTYNSTPTCCPEWPILFRTLVQIPNSSVGLQAIANGDNYVAWMVFISKLSALFPKGYFNWQKHPFLSEAKSLQRKGKVVYDHILQLATSCNLSNHALLLNCDLIPHEMAWPTKELALWPRVAIHLQNLHKEIQKEKVTAAKILRNGLFSRLAFIKFYKKNKSTSTFNYTCRHCKCTLLTLDALSKTLCMECEVHSCKFCYKLQFSPFDTYCNECTNLIAALDDPEFDVPPSNPELPPSNPELPPSNSDSNVPPF